MLATATPSGNRRWNGLTRFKKQKQAIVLTHAGQAEGLNETETMPKKKPASQGLVPVEIIERRIFVLRSRRVMLDRDLAELYGVEPSASTSR